MPSDRFQGSQRGGGRQLAAHLLNDKDKDSNDHIAVEELRGFVAQDLKGALDEMRAVAKGTRYRQFMFSLSLNPPRNARVGLDTLLSAADRAEAALGLTGQPRAIIVHEKEGRRHAHVVWSRIDPEQMKAINLPHFKNRLRDLSKELYLENAWELPDGHKTNGWKSRLNFSLAEWQQARRLDLDPREIKQIFRESWEVSDNLASFHDALEERGFTLAKGHRPLRCAGTHGEAFSLSRWSGLKSKELTGKLGEPDALPSVEDARADTRKRLTAELRGHIRQDREASGRNWNRSWRKRASRSRRNARSACAWKRVCANGKTARPRSVRDASGAACPASWIC